MPIDLSELLSPRATAVLTMEVQRNTVGDLTSLPELRGAVEDEGVLGHIRDLLVAARRAGVSVVHCTVGPDFVPGIPANFPGPRPSPRGPLGPLPDWMPRIR